MQREVFPTARPKGARGTAKAGQSHALLRPKRAMGVRFRELGSDSFESQVFRFRLAELRHVVSFQAQRCGFVDLHEVFICLRRGTRALSASKCRAEA